MALPKKRKLSVPIKRIDPQGGPENWVNQFLEKNKQFLPREVEHGDMDKSFIEFVNDRLKIIINGKEVPVFSFSLQRWAEFSKTWGGSDKYSNMKIPFVTIVRQPNPQPGTNPADFKIPVRKNFPYAKIPVWDGNRKGVDIHTIPNPVGVDLNYVVRFFSFRQRELNEFNKKMLQEFASAQAYVNVKGHYFPMYLENIGDESQITDINTKRYYVQTYEIKLSGYLVDPEEFETRPAITRTFITTEVGDKAVKPVTRSMEDDTSVKYIFQFLEGSTTETSIKIYQDVNLEASKTTNVDSFEIYLNGTLTTLPFSVTEGDEVLVSIVKKDSNSFSEVELFGAKTGC